MAQFHVFILALVAACALASAVDPTVCSSEQEQEQELQSMSLLQKDTVIVKGLPSSSTRAMAELSASGEAVRLPLPAGDEAALLQQPREAALLYGSQRHANAEEHLFRDVKPSGEIVVDGDGPLLSAQELAGEAIERSERIGHPLAPDAVLAAQHAEVRKTPLAEPAAGGHAFGKKRRRAQPGVSLLGRMAATVARHGVHAAHKATNTEHAAATAHPHEEDAETLLCAVCLFLMACFSIMCVVLEHRSSEGAKGKQFLTRTLDGPAVGGTLANYPEKPLAQPAAKDLQERDVHSSVGAPVIAWQLHESKPGASFSVALDALVGHSARAFEVSNELGQPFLSATVSTIANAISCLEISCNEDEDCSFQIVAPQRASGQSSTGGFQLFDSNGKLYGLLSWDANDRFCLRCDGQPRAFVEGLREEELQLTVFATSGAVLATSRRDPEAWAVQVEPGADAVLAVVLLLARVLLMRDAQGGGSELGPVLVE